MQFKECYECHPKPGSPVLCQQCLWVREHYKPEVEALFIDKKGFEKRMNIDSLMPFFKFPVKETIQVRPRKKETSGCSFASVDFYFERMDGQTAIYKEE